MSVVASADAAARVWTGNWPQCCHANAGATGRARPLLYRGQWFDGPAEVLAPEQSVNSGTALMGKRNQEGKQRHAEMFPDFS